MFVVRTFLAASCFLFLLSACSSNKPLAVSQKNTPIVIHYQAPEKLTFEGKAAGAGMALMSSMGPVGIAVGMAIDIGIAKEITTAITLTGKQPLLMVEQQLQQHDVVYRHLSSQQEIRLQVKSFGFKLKGAGELTSAYVEFALTDRNNQTQLFIYPNDFEKNSAFVAPSYPLPILKKEGDKAVILLQQAIDELIKQLPRFN